MLPKEFCTIYRDSIGSTIFNVLNGSKTMFEAWNKLEIKHQLFILDSLNISDNLNTTFAELHRAFVFNIINIISSIKQSYLKSFTNHLDDLNKFLVKKINAFNLSKNASYQIIPMNNDLNKLLGNFFVYFPDSTRRWVDRSLTLLSHFDIFSAKMIFDKWIVNPFEETLI